MGRGRARVLVIGAGVGGLAAAIRLAAAGAAVTVLERAAAPGGKMRSVDSAAGPVDAGPTVLTMRWVFEQLFSDAGARLEERVTLVEEPVLARHWWPDGATLDLYADEADSAAAIRAFAGPRAEREFRAFNRDARELFDAFMAPVMTAPAPSMSALSSYVMRRPRLIPLIAPHQTLAGALTRRFSDRRLAQLFGRYATYVGGSPLQAPAILSLIWRAEAAGVWRVEGGMRALAAALAALAEERGAELRTGVEVARVEMRGGRAVAAIDAAGERHEADAILFNGDPAALTAGLLGPGMKGAVPREAVAPRSLSANVWSFAAQPAGPELIHHNVFFGATPFAEFRDLDRGAAPADPTLYVCAEDRGAGAAPSGLERFEIIMNAPPATTTDENDEERARCRTLTFETLARFGLTFSPPPDDAALTTPQGFARLFPGSAGSLYGRSPHGLTATFRRPTARTAIPGLYLAGGGAHPGAGAPMATLSGRLAAAAIARDLTSTSTFRPMAMPGGMSTG